MEDGFLKIIVVVFFAIGLCCLMFEAIVIGRAYFAADSISCTWFWCTFTTVKGNMTMTQDCFSNGIRVDCPKEIVGMPNGWI
jgi:hypothetical protein